MHYKQVYLLVVIVFVMLNIGCFKQKPNKTSGLNTPTTNQHVEEKIVASDFLIAVKDHNVEGVKKLLYSKAVDRTFLQDHTKGKQILTSLSSELELDGLSNDKIKSSILILQEINRDLLYNIAYLSSNMRVSKNDMSVASFACTQFNNVKGKSKLIVLINVKGQWQIAGFPAFTPAILKYKTVQEAAHDPSIFEHDEE